MSSAEQELDESAVLAINRPGEEFRSLLEAIHSSNISNLSLLHPRGKVLFAEGEPAQGVFILRTGRAMVSISSSEGRVVTLRIAQHGDVLGLNSVLRNRSFNTTVKALEACRTNFISRTEILDLIERSQPAVQAISQMLSREVAELTERARSLLLPQTASAKLARLLLEWCEQSGTSKSDTIEISRTFTQEEIAHMICTSRETVTRMLSIFVRRKIIHVTSDSIFISDLAALQKIAAG